MTQSIHRAIKTGDAMAIFALFCQITAVVVRLFIVTIVQLLQKCKCNALLIISSLIHFVSPNNINRGGVSFAELWMEVLCKKTFRQLRPIVFKALFSVRTNEERRTFVRFNRINSRNDIKIPLHADNNI